MNYDDMTVDERIKYFDLLMDKVRESAVELFDHPLVFTLLIKKKNGDPPILLSSERDLRDMYESVCKAKVDLEKHYFPVCEDCGGPISDPQNN